LLTLGLIAFGAVVRVTDSGLGCGEHWPTCNGTLFPPLSNTVAWIEWLHRLFAVLIGLLGLGMLGVALRAYRKAERRVLSITVVAAVLFAVQSALGALVVVLKLPPTMVTLHLGTAMLLLGALLAAAVFAAYQPSKRYTADRVTTLTYVTTALSLVIILTGALVRGSGATLACIDWPLCNGQLWPAQQGQLAVVHMTHRYAVAALGISLMILLITTRRDRQDRRLQMLVLSALVMYLAQAAVGAIFVLTRAGALGGGALWGALHVGLAGATWALLVTVSALEWMHSHEVVEKTDTQWTPHSETLA
jgi:heme A synthase